MNIVLDNSMKVQLNLSKDELKVKNVIIELLANYHEFRCDEVIDTASLSKVYFQSCPECSKRYISSAVLEPNNIGGTSWSMYVRIDPESKYKDFEYKNISLKDFIYCANDSKLPLALIGYDLQNMDFENMDLSCWAFIGCNLKNAKFKNCNLQDVVFTGCDMTRTDMYGANTETIKVNMCNLDGLIHDHNLEIKQTI